MRRVTPPGRTLQRRLHSAAAVRSVRSGRADTLPGIATEVGISRTAAADVVADLLTLGWLRESSRPADGARRGRPARAFTFNARLGCAVGIDIGAHGTRVRVVDLSGDELAYRHDRADPAQPAAARLEDCAGLVRDVCRGVGIDVHDVWAVGVAGPGVVHDGVVTFYGGTGLPGWVGTDVGVLLQQSLGVPVVVEGDSASGTLGEARSGVAQGVGDVLYVLAGYRTGAGYLVGGRLHRGRHGATGLIGELSGSGWSGLEAILAGDGGVRRPTDLSADEFDDYCEGLTLGIAAQVLVLDPELVVIGGGLAHVGTDLLHEVRRRLTPRCVVAPRVELSELGDRAVVVGACVLALDDIERAVFSVEHPAVAPDPA